MLGTHVNVGRGRRSSGPSKEDSCLYYQSAWIAHQAPLHTPASCSCRSWEATVMVHVVGALLLPWET